MTAPKRRVALVSPAGDARSTLARYLTTAGFAVHEGDRPEIARSCTAVVAIDDGASDALVAEVRAWLKLTRLRRVVVVTAKPAALDELVAAYGDRLYVLPAPVFGWDVVDALRSSEPLRPRGA